MDTLLVLEILAHRDSHIHEISRVLRDTKTIPCLPCLRFGDILTELREELALPRWCGRGSEGYPCAPPEVLQVLHQGGSKKSLKDKVVI